MSATAMSDTARCAGCGDRLTPDTVYGVPINDEDYCKQCARVILAYRKAES